jgi:hypothetical protein
MESRQLADQIAAHQNVNQIKKTLGHEIKDLQNQLTSKEALLKELSNKLELLSELVLREYKKLEKELDDTGGNAFKEHHHAQSDKGESGDDKRADDKDIEQLRAEFHQEKKKAVELAQVW